jgi:hypothetical protein
MKSRGSNLIHLLDMSFSEMSPTSKPVFFWPKQGLVVSSGVFAKALRERKKWTMSFVTSFCLFACTRAVPIGRIFVKFRVWDFC